MKYAIPEDLSIPDWLKTTGVPSTGKLTDAHRGGTVEGWKVRALEDKANRAAKEAEKNAKGLARLKAEHANHKYDRVLKVWTCRTCSQVVKLCKCEPLAATHTA